VAIAHGGPRAEGTSIEAPKAPRWVGPCGWARGGGGVWGVGSAPSPENFCNSSFQMVHFLAIWRRRVGIFTLKGM